MLKVEMNLLFSFVMWTLNCFVGRREYGDHWKNLQLVKLKCHPVYYSRKKMAWDNNVGTSASKQPVVQVKERVPWVCFERELPPKSNYIGGQLLPLILTVPVGS